MEGSLSCAKAVNDVSRMTRVFVSESADSAGLRPCLGLMRLGRNHGPERLEAACLRARLLGAESYKTVKNILSNGMDRHTLPAPGPESTLPRHENIRGAACYAEGEVLPC